MRKGLKILSTTLLLSTLALAGCGKDKKDVARMENSDTVILDNLSDDATKYTILDVYNALVEKDGYSSAAKQLVNYVATSVLELDSNTSVWKTRYENLVKEKLEELASSDSYKVNGEFSEKLFFDTLKAQGYAISAPDGVTYGTPDALACDYTDYIEVALKNDIVTTLLKQKYILDETFKDRKSVITTKKVRDVEYFTVSNSLDSSYDDVTVRDFMLSLRDKIANKEVIDFEEVEMELKDLLKDSVDAEYAKIGTSKDYSQSIASEYTSAYTQDKSVGYDKKIKEVEDMSFANSVWIDSDSDSSVVVSENITSTLLSVADTTSDAYSRKVIAIKDSSDATYYYLVNPNAGASIDERDVLISESADSNYVYSVVRFRVINSETTDEADLYKAAELIASTSSLANGAVEHYLKENKDTITVYDDDVYAYLKTLYPETFTEEK